MNKKYYAHTKEGCPPEEWQGLEEHLKNVAEQAKDFAEVFGAGEWGYLAGLWHDLGKYSEAFQQKLRASADDDENSETKAGRVDHSTAGAKHAFNSLKDKGKILAYAIAGHHAGLPDGKSNEVSCLYKRLGKEIPDYSRTCPDWIFRLNSLSNPPLELDQKRASFQWSFFIRMIYSCLADADFLDTEDFIDIEKSSWRKGYPGPKTLSAKLTAHLETLVSTVPSTSINIHRAAILKSCLTAADWLPGLFSLTVPTGGGKTLSSLAFALRHALNYQKERIIYVIPYTSIIEQNSAVFREILGEEAVLEHHSNYEPKEEDHRSRLATENWDAPLIVTTNVQFFESLFSNRSSQCRKIHNIANSVVILDEAQMLPAPLLRPSIEALRELSANYKTTIVLCTATQPALSTTETFKDGLDNVREIIPNPKQLYDVFKRVKTTCLSAINDEQLSEIIREHKQALCVVNTRKHARLLYEKIRDYEGAFHLSALMCPAHRTVALKTIREALAEDLPCRVISTSLVEAGVDIDFPVVFRSITGIDSIAQAAGRCNREGKLPEEGKVFVFTPESNRPPGYFRQTAETAEMVMRHHDDPLSISAVEEYFRTLYWTRGDSLDEHQILQDLSEGIRHGDFPFKGVAEKFKIIKDGMESIIIPWNKEAEKIINELRYTTHPGSAARKAQRFTIQVPPRILGTLLAAGSLECLHEQYYILINKDIYRNDVGLCPEDPTFHEVESLIV